MPKNGWSNFVLRYMFWIVSDMPSPNLIPRTCFGSSRGPYSPFVVLGLTPKFASISILIPISHYYDYGYFKVFLGLECNCHGSNWSSYLMSEHFRARNENNNLGKYLAYQPRRGPYKNARKWMVAFSLEIHVLDSF